jgi:hypothetical protein
MNPSDAERALEEHLNKIGDEKLVERLRDEMQPIMQRIAEDKPTTLDLTQAKEDELGLTFDPAAYANGSCKTCWGRGTITDVVVGTKVRGVRACVATKNRIIRPCGCATKGYERARRAEKARRAAEKAAAGG